jgi:hypothetical protein
MWESLKSCAVHIKYVYNVKVKEKAQPVIGYGVRLIQGKRKPEQRQPLQKSHIIWFSFCPFSSRTCTSEHSVMLNISFCIIILLHSSPFYKIASSRHTVETMGRNDINYDVDSREKVE